MISPSPTQQPPQTPTPEQKVVRSTPLRKRRGETPFALAIKAVMRPPLKGLYYLIQAIRTHKLATLGIILLLLISMSVTTFFTTGSFPFGIGSDPFNFHIAGNNGGGDHIKNWLYALRDGDSTKLQLIQAELNMSQPPDPNQLISTYSQTQAHIKWTSINVIGVYSEPDTTVESFVAVDFTATGPGGSSTGVMIWHFTTLPSSGGRLLEIDLVSTRALQ